MHEAHLSCSLHSKAEITIFIKYKFPDKEKINEFFILVKILGLSCNLS